MLRAWLGARLLPFLRRRLWLCVFRLPNILTLNTTELGVWILLTVRILGAVGYETLKHATTALLA